MDILNLVSLPFNNIGAISFVYTPLLQEGEAFFNKENRTVYHNFPYKLILLVHKSDFDKGISECFRFATKLLYAKIDLRKT